MVYDSALLSLKNIQLISNLKWITRVPMTLKKTKEIIGYYLEKVKVSPETDPEIQEITRVFQINRQKQLISQKKGALFQSFYLQVIKNIIWETIIRSDRLPVRFAIATLEELRKLISAINRSVVPSVSSAAKRNPWFANNTHATYFFVFYRINLFNSFAQILMMIHISFCATCRKCGMWVTVLFKLMNYIAIIKTLQGRCMQGPYCGLPT